MGESDFRTGLKLEKAPFLLDHQTPVITMGSCFAEHIGGKLEAAKFPMAHHVFGTVFHPLAICKILGMAWQDGSLEEAGFTVNQDGVWSHFDLHSSFSALSKEEVIQSFESAKNKVAAKLQAGSVLILTFGTAFHYVHRASQQSVTNCHKIPQAAFEKRLMTVSEIVRTIQALQYSLPPLKYILTVSPVRHIKDTIELNSVSKSTLRLACHELASKEGMYYFPAYELMMDELRDYRFYGRDMIHPSPEAIDYIWARFKEGLMQNDTIQMLDDWQKVLTGLAHRPQFGQTKSYRAFLEQLKQKIAEFAPHFEVADELLAVEKKWQLAG